MARNCTEENIEETRLIPPHDPREDDDEDEEEEALSLCDLPLNLSTREVDEFPSRGEESPRNGEYHEASTKPEQEESDFRFDFGVGSSLRVGSDPAEMSTADELFFKGRILPLRHSVSLDAVSTRDPTRFLSRSESADFRRVGSFASGGSSRSSSCRSHYSSSTTTTTTGCGGGESDRRMKNNFINYSQPSPQPQIRRTSSLTARVSTSRNPKSSIWDFLRLGLVRAPEIELQDLKLRTTAANAGNAKSSVSRNSSCSSTSTSSNSKKTTGESKSRKQRNGLVLSDRRRGFLFGDCKCSVAAAEAVPLKNGVSGGGEEKQRRKKKTAKKKAEKTAMSRKRTFEWIKELSHASFVDHGRSLA